MLLNYSTTLVPLTPENVGDLNVLLGEIKQSVNHIEDENVAAGAAIDYSKLDLSGSIKNSDLDPNANISPGKLADMEDGEIIVGDGGAGKVVALHGAIKVDDQGLAYHDKIHKLQTTGSTAMPNNAVVTVPGCTDTLNAGFYRVFGRCRIIGVGGGFNILMVQVVYGLQVVASMYRNWVGGGALEGDFECSGEDVLMDGATPVSLVVKATNPLTATAAVSEGELYFRRVN